MAIETEKKYRLDKRKLVELNAKLAEIGAEFSDERFEENYLYRGGGLEEKNAVLRLRKIGDSVHLTYKERIKNESSIKHQIEYETLISDSDEMENIILALGYKLVLIYEKHRKAWNIGGCEVVLDELPFGQFMEIEGAIDDIIKVEKMLGAKDLEPEPRGYPRLTAKHGSEKNGVVEARFQRVASA